MMIYDRTLWCRLVHLTDPVGYDLVVVAVQ